MQEKAKMIDLEPEEEFEEIPMDDKDILVETKAIEIEGSHQISKMLEYIPPCRGKTKVPKDINESIVTLHRPLLSDQIVFERPCLGCTPFDIGRLGFIRHRALPSFSERPTYAPGLPQKY